MSITRYWMPWRPIYEGYAASVWLATAITMLSVAVVVPLPPGPLYLSAGFSALLAVCRAIPALQLWRWQRRLRGRPLSFITPAQLVRQQARQPRTVWLGRGFEWQPVHAQRIHEVLAHQGDTVLPEEATGGAIGAPWLHGVGARESDIRLPLEHQAGHLLLVGTTRSFKTKLLILIIFQAVLRGEAVIVIDPKGDRAVRRAMQAACRRTGRPQSFVYFHPAFPDLSARIDPLKNWNNATEIASRVAALIPSETGSDPFKAFSWNALNTIVGGLLEVEERPTLLKLRRYVEGGPEDLLLRALARYAGRYLPDYTARLAPYLKGGRDPTAQLNGWLRFYREVLAPLRPSPSLEGLSAMVRHDRVHFGKMVASLIPVLGMLTSAPLDGLLSPDPSDTDDPRRLTDMAQLLDHQQVAYLGLDSLANPTIGSAIGSLLIADLTATIGARYNYSPEFKPVTIVIDEAAEALNDPLIALLNKGAGGGARLVLATQTLGDIEARLGSPTKARQVLGNVNNLIAGRIRDAETQQYLAESLPKTRIRLLQPSQGATSGTVHPIAFTGGYQESLGLEEAALFAPEWLGLLPNLEYIALLSGSRVVKGRLPILTLPDEPDAVEKPVGLEKL